MLIVGGMVNCYLGLRLFPGPTATEEMPLSVLVFFGIVVLAIILQLFGQIFIGPIHHYHSALQMDEQKEGTPLLDSSKGCRC